MGACARGRLWDAALCLTAAFTGLRVGELLALAWREVDYGGEAIRVRRSYNVHGGVGSPTSGKVRAVPMVPDVAERLARLAGRGFWVDPEDLVFARGDEAKLLVEVFRPAGTFGEVSAETSWNVPR